MLHEEALMKWRSSKANVNCNLQAQMFLGRKERMQVGKVNLPLWEGADGTVLSGLHTLLRSIRDPKGL